MENRTEVFVDRDMFSAVVEVVAWYDAMPTAIQEEAGDTFHERVDEFITENLPPIPEVDNDDYYIEFTSVKDGNLVVTLTASDDMTESRTVTFV